MTKIRIETMNGQIADTVNFYGPIVMVQLAHGGMPPGQRDRRKVPRPPTEIDRRDLMQMVERLNDRSPVLDFMEREYGTRSPLELESNQLHHLRWYVEVLLRRN